MIRTTRWSPDTCECVIEYEWDDEIEESERLHHLRNVVSACAVHRGQRPDDNFTNVLNENATKNRVYGLLLENVAAVVDTKIDEEGNTVKTLKPGIKFDFAYDAERKLQVTLRGTAGTERTELQTAINRELGADQVVVS